MTEPTSVERLSTEGYEAASLRQLRTLANEGSSRSCPRNDGCTRIESASDIRRTTENPRLLSMKLDCFRRMHRARTAPFRLGPKHEHRSCSPRARARARLTRASRDDSARRSCRSSIASRTSNPELARQAARRGAPTTHRRHPQRDGSAQHAARLRELVRLRGPLQFTSPSVGSGSGKIATSPRIICSMPSTSIATSISGFVWRKRWRKPYASSFSPRWKCTMPSR